MGKDQSTQYSISIHTTASVVTPCILMFPVLPEISIHTTASVVTGWRTRPVTVFRFQSTPLHQWWLIARISVLLHLLFQSTPLHQWWPRGIWSVVFTLTISIHTTASVVTDFLPFEKVFRPISIHTTASVVTSTQVWKRRLYSDFNPHHCISGDLCSYSASRITNISIHTTASVVTSATTAKSWAVGDFNPHHCISGDGATRLKGAGSWDFNPHHCISGDWYFFHDEGRYFIFQSTPLHQWWHWCVFRQFYCQSDFNPHHCISGDGQKVVPSKKSK